ncbi:MAG: anhydro-N-acetylmuramic acid kinase [Proteobacteria bacterium]|nr:anhydro-N-acetylmuramic acid kinase [Pseudomonadota bacterium]
MRPQKSPQVVRVLGFMSGTSLDGVDAALLETDGLDVLSSLGHAFVPYPTSLQDALLAVMAREGGVLALSEHEKDNLAHQITQLHLEAARNVMAQTGVVPQLVGFHGQTIYHNPERRTSIQLGDPVLLSEVLGVPVIHTFRQNDLDHGGQGAPLVPIYHAALAKRAARPCLFVNVGGISNLTWCGEEADGLIAFDAGPANAPLNDWTKKHFGACFDRGGALAAKGRVHTLYVEKFLSHTYFAAPPPKSLDRGTFDFSSFEDLLPHDGLATLTRLVAEAIVLSARALPPVKGVYVCGGGRHNLTLRAHLEALFTVPVQDVETLGVNGDFLEAEAFAYLAKRAYDRLPISFPGSTGVSYPVTGGVCAFPKDPQKVL